MYHLCHGGCGTRDTANAASGALAALAQVAHIRRLAQHTAAKLMKTPGSVSPAVIEGRLSNKTRLRVMVAGLRNHVLAAVQQCFCPAILWSFRPPRDSRKNMNRCVVLRHRVTFAIKQQP